MTGSNEWKGTKYIEDFIVESRKNFTLEHINIISVAVFRTIVSLKKYGASVEYIREFEQRIVAHDSIFVYLCLMATNKANTMKAITHITKECDGPLECGLLHEVFEDANRKLIARLQCVNPRIPYQTLLELINDLDEACLLLIFHFLDIAKSRSVIERIEDELILLEEAESLKNRKEKYNEGNESSDR